MVEWFNYKMIDPAETSDFRFVRENIGGENLELPFAEHVEELRQRAFHVLLGLILFSTLAFVQISPIVQTLEAPVRSVKFFQLSPGDYFITTVKIALYTGILMSSPLTLNQITLFVIPGLNKNEKRIVIPMLVGSTLLFFLSLLFSYFFLIPAALNFFISYSQEAIEPLLSFNQYFDFILVLFYTTGLAFQIPIFQIILGVLGIVSGKQMFSLWRYVVLTATIVGAILTPSTDPITQILLSGAILILYLLGASAVALIKQN